MWPGDHRKERVETGRPVCGAAAGKTGRRWERQEGFTGSRSSGMGRKVEFRNILVELIGLSDKLNAGYGEKESSKIFLGFFGLSNSVDGWWYCLLKRGKWASFLVSRLEKSGHY